MSEKLSERMRVATAAWYFTDEVAALEQQLAAKEQMIAGQQKELHTVEQALGRALGYPWYKDDQKNFPGATEADGVCVGEHTPSSIADEAASRLAAKDAEIERLRKQFDVLKEFHGHCWCGECDADFRSYICPEGYRTFVCLDIAAALAETPAAPEAK